MARAAVAVPCAGSSSVPRLKAASFVDAACVRLWLNDVAARLEAERDFLTQLDAALGDHERFGPKLLGEALRASLEGVQRVGAASPGDKTMVDALTPALAAYELELRMGGSLETAVSGAREAAAEGMRATIPLQARKGRASYLGPRSVGHQDPGATSTALMFAALAHAVLADRSQRFASGARRPVSGPWSSRSGGRPGSSKRS